MPREPPQPVAKGYVYALSFAFAAIGLARYRTQLAHRRAGAERNLAAVRETQP